MGRAHRGRSAARVFKEVPPFRGVLTRQARSASARTSRIPTTTRSAGGGRHVHPGAGEDRVEQHVVQCPPLEHTQQAHDVLAGREVPHGRAGAAARGHVLSRRQTVTDQTSPASCVTSQLYPPGFRCCNRSQSSCGSRWPRSSTCSPARRRVSRVSTAASAWSWRNWSISMTGPSVNGYQWLAANHCRSPLTVERLPCRSEASAARWPSRWLMSCRMIPELLT